VQPWAWFETCGLRLTVWRGGVEGPGHSTPPPWSRVEANGHVRLKHALPQKGSTFLGTAIALRLTHIIRHGAELLNLWMRSPPARASAVHAAAPRSDGMKIRFFSGGLRAPKPSRGRGYGEAGFPIPLSEGLFCAPLYHLAEQRGASPPRASCYGAIHAPYLSGQVVVS